MDTLKHHLIASDITIKSGTLDSCLYHLNLQLELNQRNETRY